VEFESPTGICSSYTVPERLQEISSLGRSARPKSTSANQLTRDSQVTWYGLMARVAPTWSRWRREMAATASTSTYLHLHGASDRRGRFAGADGDGRMDVHMSGEEIFENRGRRNFFFGEFIKLFLILIAWVPDSTAQHIPDERTPSLQPLGPPRPHASCALTKTTDGTQHTSVGVAVPESAFL